MGQKRGSNHNKVQKQGKERDLYTCQVCGSKVGVQGHHIIDYKFGGAANEENIITLCSHHHKKVHAKKIDIVKF